MLVVVGSVVALVSGIRQRLESRAFRASSMLIFGLLATGAATIYPVMLYSTLAPENSLTAEAVASSPGSLFAAFLWWPVAFVMTASYFIFISRHYAGKVSVKRDNQGLY